MSKAKSTGLPIRAPKVLQDEMLEADRACVRLLGRSRPEVHDLLQLFRAGLVAVGDPGPAGGLTGESDLILVPLDLYVALHDLDRAWAKWHAYRAPGGERAWVSTAIAKAVRSLAIDNDTRRASAKSRGQWKELSRTLDADYRRAHPRADVATRAAYVAAILNEWRANKKRRANKKLKPLTLRTVAKYIQGPAKAPSER